MLTTKDNRIVPFSRPQMTAKMAKQATMTAKMAKQATMAAKQATMTAK